MLSQVVVEQPNQTLEIWKLILQAFLALATLVIGYLTARTLKQSKVATEKATEAADKTGELVVESAKIQTAVDGNLSKATLELEGAKKHIAALQMLVEKLVPPPAVETKAVAPAPDTSTK